MSKSTFSVLAAVFLLSPAALADRIKEVTLTHEYDAALLSSDAGTSLLLDGLTKAAKRTCTSRIPAHGGFHTDLACTESLVTAAVRDIHAAHTIAGTRMAPSFSRMALMQLASSD